MDQWGIFSDEAADWTEGEALEADFWSEEEARAVMEKLYDPEDHLCVHVIEEADEDGEE